MPEPEAPVRHLVLGTAGHIDHGKTALIKALTGIDCDTLAEEKQRGITIDLGFACLDLPGVRLGIIDVPGHARFIRNMVAGASGIDLVMLVVAANDGVMPQTVEHLQICRLLGVSSGLVALTKADLVEPDLLELVTEEVRELTAGTFLAGRPIVPVSSKTGHGQEQLKTALQKLVIDLPRATPREYFRLAIDRSFSVRGAGTVVTGTVMSGQVALDDELEVLPGGQRVRVRGIQVHGENQGQAVAGERAALNLTGLDKQELVRGHVLAAPGILRSSQLLDCELSLLPGRYRPLRSSSAAELHIGTSELPVRVRLLDSLRLVAGAVGLAQLQLDRPLACAAGDRFILRSSDGQRTLGGGVVLDPHPGRHIRRRIAAVEQLVALDLADPDTLLLHEADKTQYGLLLETACRQAGISIRMPDNGNAAGLQFHDTGRQTFVTSPANRERLRGVIVQRLEAYHGGHPLSRRGLSIQEFSAALAASGAAMSGEALTVVLNAAAGQGTLILHRGTYALPGRSIKLTAKDNQALKVLLAATRSTTTPLQPDDLLAQLPVDKKRLGQLVAMLVEDGDLLTAPGAVYFDPAVVDGIRRKLRARLDQLGSGTGLSVSDFTTLVGTTRKYGIPLLQLFENENWLKRDGDVRRLSGQ